MKINTTILRVLCTLFSCGAWAALWAMPGNTNAALKIHPNTTLQLDANATVTSDLMVSDATTSNLNGTGTVTNDNAMSARIQTPTSIFGSTIVNGELATGDPTQTARLFRDGVVSACSQKVCPGPTAAGLFRFDQLVFINTRDATTCFTITVQGPSTSPPFILAVAYLTTYDSGNVCANYLGDLGNSPDPGPFPFSVNVPAGATFVVVISDVSSNETATLPYTVTVSGGSTPGPTATPGGTPTPTATPTASSTPFLSPTPGPTATPTLTPAPTPPGNNISTRARIETGDNVVVGGFIIAGNAPRRIMVRAIGPSLVASGITDALADPTLNLSASASSLNLMNDNWRDTQESEIQATGLPPSNDLESAIVATLPPGSYTAIIAGRNQGSGVGLLEIYDLDRSVDSKVANISTRAFVQTGDNVLIGGFMLGGDNDQRAVVRGIGPSLRRAGLSNALEDPTLTLHNGNGDIIAANDDWKGPVDNPQAHEIKVRGLAPTDNLESALIATLPPGPYTAIVSGKNGGIGIGLVEIYNLQ